MVVSRSVRLPSPSQIREGGGVREEDKILRRENLSDARKKRRKDKN